MKNYLTTIFLCLILTSPLFGQSSEDKKFAVRTSIFAHALTYNLNKQISYLKRLILKLQQHPP